MARQPMPWYRADRKVWCITIDGKRHNLGRERKAAFVRFREMLRNPTKRREPIAATSFVGIVDEFLDWVSRNRAPDTFEW